MFGFAPPIPQRPISDNPEEFQGRNAGYMNAFDRYSEEMTSILERLTKIQEYYGYERAMKKIERILALNNKEKGLIVRIFEDKTHLRQTMEDYVNGELIID